MIVPHFQQELDYSCLPACVRMVLAFYQREVAEGELRGLFKTRPGGTSPANLLLRLPALGFNVEFPDASLSYVREQIRARHPCIVHVWTPPLPHWTAEAIHALVVVDVAEQAVLAHDPVLNAGPTSIALEHFIPAWASAGYVMVVITPA